MDIGLYHRFLEEYVQQAYDSSDGTPAGITEGLRAIKLPGRFTRHKEERQAALREALKAFEDHRHWPLEIIFSHLGVEIKKKKHDCNPNPGSTYILAGRSSRERRLQIWC